MPLREALSCDGRRDAFSFSMRLKHDIDLGYCTNIHRGETWEETFKGLQRYTDEVRKQVAGDQAYGIGLRLGADAASELASSSDERNRFRKWLDATNSYVFTVNGFPYGTFHGSRVKEQVYAPDWTSDARLTYTNQLFDLITDFAPADSAVSVSTLPGSFKEFIQPETEKEQKRAIFKHLRSCSDHIERLRDKTGRDIHLGLEPEPLGLFETSGESVSFFEELVSGLGSAEQERILRNIGINYDTCHLAIEYEEPEVAIANLRNAGIRISKIHLSSALRLEPTPEAVAELAAFQDDVYLHQVVIGKAGKVVRRIKDLPEALKWYDENSSDAGDEWRVHFHIPIHVQPGGHFRDTRSHIDAILKLLGEDPGWCQHFEMETYTWEVMPGELRSDDVVAQLVNEYEWCLGAFRKNGLA